MTMTSDTRNKVQSVVRQIKTQIHNTPESNLMFAVLEQTIRDCFLPITGISARVASRCRASAIEYLNGNMYHAEIIGIDSDWVRRKIEDSGLDLASALSI